jgi:hypothetical protein
LHKSTSELLISIPHSKLASSCSLIISRYIRTMCIVNYNLYACKHKVVLNVDKCPEKLQGIPCSTIWKEAQFRVGECMSCVMEEPAGQVSSSRNYNDQWSQLERVSSGHRRQRDCRFPTVNGCRWHSGFPKSGTGQTQHWASRR